MMSQTAQHGVSHINPQLYNLIFMLFKLYFVIRFVLFWTVEGQETRKCRRGRWWWDKGMWECPVSHNSAGLEVNWRSCGQACFSHLGLLRTKPDPIVWLSFSFCLSLQWTCHPSSALTVYFDRLFGKESETIHWALTWRFTTGITMPPCVGQILIHYRTVGVADVSC